MPKQSDQQKSFSEIVLSKLSNRSKKSKPSNKQKQRPDKNKGVIYLATCKTSNKSYVGQACNYVNGNTIWGTKGRWNSHLRDAVNINQNRCRYLNNAIRKYGKNDFDVTTIGEFDLEELDEKETKYIEHYNTIVPYGYNLNYGGIRGNDSYETKKRKKHAKLGHKHSENTKTKISLKQIGNRRTKKKRKYKEDEHLPKYIRAVRKNKEIIGYCVSCFPIGINTKKHAPAKFFFGKAKLPECLRNAKDHLVHLKKKYAHVQDEIIKRNDELEKEALKNFTKDQKQQIRDKLPKYIHPIFNKQDKVDGYYVEGFPKTDGISYSRKDFTDLSSNYINLQAAKRYIKSLHVKNKDSQFVVKNDKDISYQGQQQRADEASKSFPKYVSYSKDRNKEITGYCINNFPVRDKNNKIIKRIKRRFCSKKIPMKIKWKRTIECLEELKKKYGTYNDNNAVFERRYKTIKSRLPDEIYPIMDEGRLIGHIVKCEIDGELIEKEFIHEKGSTYSRKDAKNFLAELKED